MTNFASSYSTTIAPWHGTLSWWSFQFFAMAGHMRITILQACQYLHVKCSIYGGSSRHKLLLNNATSVEKNNQHSFDFGFSNLSFFWMQGPLCVLFWTLTFCLWVTLKHPRFIAGNDIEKIFIFLDAVQNFLRNFHLHQFLFLAQDFQHQLRTHFPHRKILLKWCGQFRLKGCSPNR